MKNDQIVLAKHRSGLKFTLCPSLAGDLKIWIDLSGASVVGGTTYRNRAKFAKFLRFAARKIEDG